jgi:hypothetical protein
MKSTNFILIFTLFAFLPSCQQEKRNDQPDHQQSTSSPLFKLLAASETGIDFANHLKEDTTFNILNYLYFYNGGGVSIGDINNDSLPDIYFTANQLPNKLYLNKGNFKFEDITKKAGVAGTLGWTTGTSMADVNGDGWLDIYVCNVSGLLGLNTHNQLFINNQNGTFSEKSKEYGLDFSGFATQAAFFDCDNDGDLDCYLLNHSTHYEGTLKRADEIRPEKNERAGDKLMKNENGKFIDVSSLSGIYSSAVGYGLGISIGDLNQDGWQDIYIANDFHENDYVYLNNQNGTFTESIKQITGHTSKFSMGVDMADFNNDGRLDVFSADMMPENEQIRKQSEESADAYSIYLFKNSFGYHHQFAKNALQLNIPIATHTKNEVNFQFAEIAQLAGVATTDWSWSVLFADLDNDGWKDLLVANGIPHRPNDMDYLKFVSEPAIKGGLQMGLDEAKLKYVEKMPVIKIGNYAFKNNKDLTFNNLSKNWGLDKAGFSNGSAYADLDNDGDLDLVINNINDQASIYKNESEQFEKNNYLKIKLLGENKNTSGIGAKITLKSKDNSIYYEQSPTRGFQSSSDHVLTIGLGKSEIIDTLIVTWLNGKSQSLTNVRANQFLTLKQNEASSSLSLLQSANFLTTETLFQDITNQVNIPFKHEENAISDFEREFLIPYALSTQGSKMGKGDVNNDGLEDIFIPNGKWKASALFIQQKNSSFKKAQQTVFEPDSICEDVSAAFFDADSDCDLDLIVVSAGNEFYGKMKEIQPRLYLNDGKGNFVKTTDALPDVFLNASCVKPADFDGDGDMDLFIGARIETRKFGTNPQSYLLENQTPKTKGSKVKFIDATLQNLPYSGKLGMVTDAVWADFNNDQQLDLVVVGEWMPLTFLENKKGKFTQNEKKAETQNSNGFWNSIIADDFDNDGDVDFVAGNWGQNSYLKPTEKEPITLYVKDFDNNGSPDPIICTYRTNSEGQRVSYPLPSKDEMTSQLPHLRKKFLKYKQYATATIGDIFSADSLKDAIVKYAYNFNTSYIENKGNGRMEIRSLPVEAQFSVVSALQSGDFDGDGKKDILLAGNFYGVTPLLSRYDASIGLLLRGNGKGDFLAVSPTQSGFISKGECRDIQLIKLANGKTIALIMRNNATLQAFAVQKIEVSNF